MELFLFHFRQTGYTLKQGFLRNPAFGTVTPENLEAILSTNFKGKRRYFHSFSSSLLGYPHQLTRVEWSFGPRREIACPMFGDGIFTQEGGAWKQSRNLLRPQLVQRQYEDFKLFNEPIDDLLRALPRSTGIIDLQPLFFRFTLDVTTVFLFGDSIHSLKSSGEGPEKDFAVAFDISQSYVVKRFRLLDLYWLIGGTEFREACRVIHNFADQVIDLNLFTECKGDQDSEKYVFLKSLAQSCPDRDILRGQIINILTAGRDTTACLLSWTL